ncbi:MAG: hypothetical protein ABJC66_11450 [Gammaproteobacteria bacterium]
MNDTRVLLSEKASAVGHLSLPDTNCGQAQFLFKRECIERSTNTSLVKLQKYRPVDSPTGAGVGMLIHVYFIGVIAAIAIPAYQDYTVRALLAGAAAESQPARRQLVQYYLAKNSVPDSLSEAGVAEQLPNGNQLSLSSKGMVLTVHSKRGELIFTPKRDPQGQISRACTGGTGVKPQQLPPACR